MNKYYVYIYLDPRKPGNYQYGEYSFDYEPFYVGKGYYKRMLSHLNRAKNKNVRKITPTISKIRKLLKLNLVPIIKIVTENLIEQESFNLEISLIKLIGRKEFTTGPLLNLTNGGDGVSGLIVSKETRKKLSKASKGRIPPNKGIPLTSEHKQRLREANLGKKQSEETKQKRKETMEKNPYRHSNERKQKMRESKLGDKNPSKRPEVRAKISSTQIGRKQSKETKLKRAKSLTKYINIKVQNLKTNEILIFENKKDLAKYFNIKKFNTTTFIKRGKIYNKIYKIYI